MVRGVDQLLAQQEDFGWALPEWERGVHIPVAALPAPSMGGDGWTDGQDLYYTLCTGLPTAGVCVSTAQLLLHAGQELHCQHVSRGQSFHFPSFFFLSFFPLS